MSAVYIVRFHGYAMQQVGRALVVVEDHNATQFTSEANAWIAVHHHNLQPLREVTVTAVNDGGAK